MRKSVFILLAFIFVYTSCDFTNSGIRNPSIGNCQTDTLNIPSIDILWEKDLNLIDDDVLGPIVYNDFILIGKEKTLSFFNKETGVLERTLEVNISTDQSQNLDNILRGNCFIKGEHLVYQRHFQINNSYDYDTLYTELLHLETGLVSQIDKILTGFSNSSFNKNNKIHLLGDGYLSYENLISNAVKVKLTNIFDGTETIIGNVPRSVTFGNNIWESSAGDTLISFSIDNFKRTQLTTFNVSKGKTEIDFNLEFRTDSRRLLVIDNDVIYLRGRNELIAIDVLSKSTLWEISDLNRLYISDVEPYEHNLHITDKYAVDISRGSLSVFDKSTGELIFNETNMPNTIINARTIISNDELIVSNDGILRLDLNNGCAIWKKSEPTDNQGFSGVITKDETLNRLYSIKDGQLVSVQL